MNGHHGDGSLPAWRDAFHRLDDCPWPGPRPLTTRDVELIGGRETEGREFRRIVDEHRLVLLDANSGVGKSSLLRANLVPGLRSSGYRVAVVRNWSQTAGATDSIDFISERIKRSLGRQGIAISADGAGVLPEVDRRFGEQAVLILDQFEELIRYARTFKDHLFGLLAEINEHSSIKVVVSFRSEYLHELRALQARIRPYTMAHFVLSPIDPAAALEVINAPNRVLERDGLLAIDSAAAELVKEDWIRALEVARATDRSPVGLLHLQALLYALHETANQGRVPGDGSSLIPVTESSVEGLRTAVGLPDGETLSAVALGASLNVKLRRCRLAAGFTDLLAENGIDSRPAADVGEAPPVVSLDPILQEGTVKVLARSVVHLSSAGFKLHQAADDLLTATLESRLEMLREAAASSSDAPGETPDGDLPVDTQRSILAVVLDSVLLTDPFDDDEGEDDDADWAAGPEPGSDPPGEHDRSPEDLLAATRADLAGRATVPTLTARLHPGAHPLAADPDEVTCGPMLGSSPVAVLLEEVRRFGFALEWLRASSVVRLSTPGTGRVMVELVHDGFGDALETWSKQRLTGASDAFSALTAGRGERLHWRDAGDRLLDKLPVGGGAVDAGRHLVNLRWKGAWVSNATFRGVIFVNCDLAGTFFDQCTFEGVTFLNCTLDGAMLSDCTILGRPSDAPDAWSVQAPEFVLNLPIDELRVLAGYRDAAGGDSAEPDILISQLPGLPAVPYVSADLPTREPIRASRETIVVEPGGLVLRGGRVSALILRGCKLPDGAQVSLREVAGSGFDVVEVDGPGSFEIIGSAIRHVTLSTGRRGTAGDQSFAVSGSTLGQLWIGDEITGALAVTDSLVVHLWNGSSAMATLDHKSAFHGIVNFDLLPNPDPDADVKDLQAWARAEGERPWGIDEADPKTTDPGSEASVNKLRERGRSMDYRRAFITEEEDG